MVVKKIKRNTGFTLIEIMVAVSIFAIVMLISTGAILSVVDANRKSQNLRAVMDNLNYTLESMTRTIRFGTNYHCNLTVTNPAISAPNDCASGASSMAVMGPGGIQVRYRYDATGKFIERSIDGGTTYIRLTSADVTIDSLTFYVFGSSNYTAEGAGPHYQPRAIIVVKGYSGVKATARSSFTLQTTVSQRMVDSL